MGDFFNLSTDNTLGGNAPIDFITPSQKAVKAYIDRYDDELRAFASEPHRVILSSTSLSSYTSASNMRNVALDLFPDTPDYFNEKGDIILIYTQPVNSAVYLNLDNIKSYFPTGGSISVHYCRKISVFVGCSSTSSVNVYCHLPGMTGTTTATGQLKQTSTTPTGSFSEIYLIGHQNPNFCLTGIPGGSYSPITKYTTWQ